MKKRLLSLSVVMFILLALLPMSSFADSDTTITNAAIGGVTAPIKGATPVSAITPTAEYTGTVTWSGSPTIFAGDTVYTATITLTPNIGYTLTGVAANFFTIDGAPAGTTVTNLANSGVITVVFPKTEPDTVITLAAIGGVTAPVKGATPVAVITPTAEYTGTVAWSGSPATFASDTVYTATITLIPATGYTLTGVAANFFTIDGAPAGTTATNLANSGVITVVFPKTEPDTVITLAAIGGVTAPVKGATPVTAITPTAEYTGTVTWSGSPTIFAGDTVYTATITLTPNIGYTLTGVPANFFTINGAPAGTTVTNLANSGVITVVFPKTEPDTVITIAAIGGVTAPAKGATPVTIITPTVEYTGTVAWSGSPTTFAGDTVYTATITLTPNIGYTLTGVPANFFTIDGAPAGTTVTNLANSGVITAVFPKTAVEDPKLVSAETSTDGSTVILTFDKDMADPSTDIGSFAVWIHGLYNYENPIALSMKINSAVLNAADPKKIYFILDNPSVWNLNAPLQRGDIITVDYAPGTVKSADGGVLQAFTAQPVTNTIPVSIDTNLEGTWQIYDHVGNWQEVAYPVGNDPRGGRSFNRHIVIDGKSAYFYGNGVRPFKDFLYLPSAQAAAKSFSFDLDLNGVNYHSMEGGGFLFNTEINSGVLNGYCALFTIDYNMDSTVKEFTVNLYQLEGVNVNSFHDGIGSYEVFANFDSNPSDIKKVGSFKLPKGNNKHSIKLEVSSTTVDMWDGTQKIIETFTLPKAYSNGVGVIGSYKSHNCTMLSYFIFSNLNIQGIADLAATFNNGFAALKFTAPTGATTVSVEQSTDAGATWNPSDATTITETSTTATVSGLQSNQLYYFRLKIKGGKYNGYSKVATAQYTEEVIITPVTPAPPSTPPHTVYYTLTVDKTGEGTILPLPGEYHYSEGVHVELTATPAEGYTFEGWTGTTGNIVLMDRDQKVTAVFKQIAIPTEEPVPAANVEPTPIPTPEAALVTQPEDSTPAAPAKLPKTGGIPAVLFYGLGGTAALAGAFIRRRMK